MPDNLTRQEELYLKWFNQQCSPAELRELFDLLEANGADAHILPLLKKSWESLSQNAEYVAVMPDLTANAILEKYPAAPDDLQQTKPVSRIRSLKTTWRWTAAAVLILAIGSGVYYFNSPSYKSHKSSQITVQTITAAQEIPPGTNKAILTLSNGTQKELSAADNGLQLKSDAVLLTTPNGGQYQAVLPDGSKVWLNAASSIKFPSKFSDKERRIEITGEVYMEIAQNAKQPFYAAAGKTMIHVLGTAFNINAYTDETSQRTTLVNGSVRVMRNNQQAILRPGETADIKDKINVVNVDVDQVVAWKNGIFNIEGMDLQTVLKQLARWYDFSVQYDSNLPLTYFQGKMDRSLTLQQVLKILSQIQPAIQFTLKEKTLIVTERKNEHI